VLDVWQRWNGLPSDTIYRGIFQSSLNGHALHNNSHFPIAQIVFIKTCIISVKY